MYMLHVKTSNVLVLGSDVWCSHCKHELVKLGICAVCCLLHSNQTGSGAHPAS